jgi:hypothetical protein
MNSMLTVVFRPIMRGVVLNAATPSTRRMAVKHFTAVEELETEYTDTTFLKYTPKTFSEIEYSLHFTKLCTFVDE